MIDISEVSIIRRTVAALDRQYTDARREHWTQIWLGRRKESVRAWVEGLFYGCQELVALVESCIDMWARATFENACLVVPLHYFLHTVTTG